VLGVRACEGCTEPLEVLGRQRLLNHREDDALLVADVALEALPSSRSSAASRTPPSLDLVRRAASFRARSTRARAPAIELGMPSERRQ
jgi:hypothetical protein